MNLAETLENARRDARGPWKKDTLARAKALPDDLQATLRGVIKRGHVDTEAQEQLTVHIRAAQVAGELPELWQMLGEVLVPQFADLFARTAEHLMAHGTYTVGYSRRAFRWTEHPQMSRKMADWVWGVWGEVREYPQQDLHWFAAYFDDYFLSHTLGPLLARALDEGDDALLELIRAAFAGEHPVARADRLKIAALLRSTRPDAHELVRKLLLAAQRQEGLRQVILETADEGSVEGFRYILDTVLEHDLLRFASAVRAAAVWFGLAYDVSDKKVVAELLTSAQSYLSDPAKARAAVQTGTGRQVYTALFVLGMQHAGKAAEQARPLLTDADPERRMAAFQFLKVAELLTVGDLETLLADEDLRLASFALQEVTPYTTEKIPSFAAVRDLAERLPAKEPAGEPEPLLFPWFRLLLTRADAADRLAYTLGVRRVQTDAPKQETDLSALQPYLGWMSPSGRWFVVQELKEVLDAQKQRDKPPTLCAGNRALLPDLMQDRSADVAGKAAGLAGRLTPTEAEREAALGLLTRKSAGLRRGLIGMLAGDEAEAEASALWLLAQKNTMQRQAGLELLQEVGGSLPADFAPKNAPEQTLADAFASNDAPEVTLADGLGLFDPAALTQPTPPTPSARDFAAEVARGAELLRSLDALIRQHAEAPLHVRDADGDTVELLMNARFWQLKRSGETEDSIGLADVWQKWWRERGGAQDGDLMRLRLALWHREERPDTTETELLEELGGEPDGEQGSELEADIREMMPDVYELLGIAGGAATPEDDGTQTDRQRLERQVLVGTLGPKVTLELQNAELPTVILDFLQQTHYTDADTELALDAWETAMSRLPTDARLLPPEKKWWLPFSRDPRDLWQPFKHFLQVSEVPDPERYPSEPLHLSPYFARLWRLQHFEAEAFTRLPRLLLGEEVLVSALELGLINRHDALRQLIGTRPANEDYAGKAEDVEGGSLYMADSFHALHRYARKRLPEDLPATPQWLELVQEVVDRVLEVELQRGELETPATPAALNIGFVSGADVALRLLAGMDARTLKRGFYWRDDLTRDTVFSHLLRVSFPAPDDTPQSFAAAAKALGLSNKRLQNMAMFAPQWADLISEALGVVGLRDGVLWLHAHTKDRAWSVEREVRDAWAAQIAEHTPLTADELTDGAVDVAWFRRMYAELGAAQFAELLASAKYASSSGGHKRAELFAQALLGKVKAKDLEKRITDKRHQDSVRALGLLPLPTGAKGEKELERRYSFVQKFRKGARKFGSQRQASERLAADVGLYNLARTAGYTDPQHLQWAMEARTAAPWPAPITRDDVHLQAVTGENDRITLEVRRGDKLLKNIPAGLKKDPEVAAMREAVRELEATRRRMREALEMALVRGDLFTPAELRDLGAHPVIRPMLERLVFVLNEDALGFWAEEVLQTLDGPTDYAGGALRLAHPHDLYTSGRWADFQARLLEGRIAQPFKQVFREYYPPTAQEGAAIRSERYSGHMVQPTQAMALLKSRGWVVVPEEGVRKTDHAEGINVWVDVVPEYGTPNEVGGMPLRAAYFVRRGEYEPMPLEEVPPRLFSEAMRDLDLVVSVAHVGGVDPEASQSTVEMRAGLLQETLRLLKLSNVRLESQHALIDGELSHYTVHLGSGTVHRQPGGFVCMVPVHNQQQGRVFLPFADPDPRTAEVVSKVLLLAEDGKIQDPTILEQLR